MAINSIEACNRIRPRSSASTNSNNSSNSASLLTKISIDREGNVSATSKFNKVKKNQGLRSPYLTGDRVQLLSRITEKRLVHRKATDFISSFPLAANIYKANSDELRPVKRNNRKNKKSVLTLPNEQAHVPEACTVSDMNDYTEYHNRDNENNKTIRKKRTPQPNSRKLRSRNKNFEFYDRDAQYCSQMNIDLDCSSTDIINPYNGDGSRLSKKSNIMRRPHVENECNPHDVWAVLRNINKFQFTPSPPISDEIIVSQKKNKRINKKRNNRKDTRRVIETCRTEEFAYISSFDIDSKSPSFSPTSSFDRITVIDKQNGFSKICKALEKGIVCSQNRVKGTSNIRTHDQTKAKALNKKCTNTAFKNVKANKKENDNEEKNCQVLPVRNDVETYINSIQKNNNTYKEQLCTKNVTGDNFLSYNSDQLSLNIKGNNNNDSNNLRTKMKNDKFEQFADSFVYSGDSRSSKAGLNNTNNSKKDKNKLAEVSSNESDQHTKAITKIVLSEGLGVSESCNYRNRKPRLVTTMPSTSITPKLTQTEIKRRLNNTKFPITVLGKDQVSSSPMRVEIFEQFQGLDEHIWPFMVGWYSQNSIVDGSDNKKHGSHNIESLTRKNNRSERTEWNVSVIKKIDRETTLSKDVKDNKRFNFDHSIHNKKIKYPLMVEVETRTNNNIKLQQGNLKMKPIRQFKNNILKLLYKKPSVHSLSNSEQIMVGQGDGKTRNNTNICTCNSIRKQVDVGTETLIKSSPNNGFSLKPSIRSLTKVKRPQNTRYPWAKGKWASDFIENVIKKIKTGIYYNQENKDMNNRSSTDSKEASIQTTSDALQSTKNKNNDAENQFEKLIEVIDSEKYMLSVLGFNSALPALEIKTLNVKEITVKHCLTNVLVQFDVTVPMEQDSISMDKQKPFSFIPLSITDSQTRIFKCKTRIFNAMLPAELCSIVPKVMRNISDFHVQLSLSSMLLNNKEPHLSTISEITPRENPYVSPSQPYLTTELKGLLLGRFFKPIKNEIKINMVCFNLKNETDLLKNVQYIPLLFDSLLYHISFKQYNKHSQKLIEPLRKTYLEVIPERQNCTILQPYIASKHCLIEKSVEWNFVEILKKICNCANFNLNFHLPSNLLPKCGNQNITMNISNDYLKKTAYIAFNNMKIDSIYNGFMNCNNILLELNQPAYYTPIRCIEHVKREQKKSTCTLNQPKTKKRRYVQLYRKCKSTSIISAEGCNTSITKIGNIDDFFQALGSGKLLSSVFDGRAAKKILTCIIEMKNWISEISQRQAMLVLLLANKKDTPNLVRFRPVLLQGIAVKRITRASDLDMEIEVIERENFNKLSQYEGISYLTASVENQDNLLEELYWIAKTTASDYRLPFDETSERLLKSLLKKRKKLNPSYLRVMARYVGLGLLKPPSKK